MAREGVSEKGTQKLARLSSRIPSRKSMKFRLDDGDRINIVIRREGKRTRGATTKTPKAISPERFPSNVNIHADGTIVIDPKDKHVRIHAYEANSSDVIVDSNCP